MPYITQSTSYPMPLSPNLFSNTLNQNSMSYCDPSCFNYCSQLCAPGCCPNQKLNFKKSKIVKPHKKLSQRQNKRTFKYNNINNFQKENINKKLILDKKKFQEIKPME